MSITHHRRRGAAALIAGTAVVATVLVGCSPTTEAPPAEESGAAIEPLVINYADYLTETSTFGRMSLAFQEAVTERTDGAVTFENYWAGALLGAPEQLSGVRDGTADIALIFGGNFPAELPVASWLLGLGLDQGGSPLHDFVAGSAAIQEIVQDYEPLLTEFAGHNVKPLYWTSTVPFAPYCVEPAESEAAFAGRNTRAAGVYQSGATEALGGVPVTLAFNEIYEGLQRGVIDCQLVNPGAYAAYGFEEVSPEFLPLPVISPLGGYTVNLEFWESLQPELQNIIYEEAAKATVLDFSTIELGDTSAFGALLESDAVHINDVSELLPLLTDYQEETLASLADTAPAGVTDPEAIIERFAERKAYWTDVLVELGYPLVDGTDSDAVYDFYVNAADVDLAPFWERFREESVLTTLPN